MEGFSRSLLLFLLCLINTAHANTPPSIDVTTYTICVDIPPGEHAFTIAASDLENDPLTFTTTGYDPEYFTVEENTGVVRVRRPLDRQEYTMQFGVVVSDGTTAITANLLIILTPSNSYTPQFDRASYNYSCPENTAVGSSLFTVKATDEDTGFAGSIRYSIESVTPISGLGLFSISQTSGEVSLTGSLSYSKLSNSYLLTIKATDGGGNCHFDEPTYLSSDVDVVIRVVDVPDLDPMFLGAPYAGEVLENSPLNQTVLQVTAVDQDTGVNDKIVYSIEDSSVDGLFGISDDGVISIVSVIDRENLGGTDTVTLTVKATESNQNIYGVYASNTTIIPIKIIVNNHKPLFYECGIDCVMKTHFTARVPENYEGSIPLKMTVRDLDEVSKTNLTLGGENRTVFSVEPQFTEADSIVQLVVKQPDKLDFEQTHRMIVEVIATDQYNRSLCSTATVIIGIDNRNDNTPEFISSNRVFAVESESMSNGTLVAEVTAIDRDLGQCSQIEFKVTEVRFTDSNSQTHNMGLLFVAITKQQKDVYVGTILTTERLNGTLKGKFWVTVTATDTGGLSTSAVLEILTVDKVNDVHLKFSSSVEEVEEKLDDIIRVLRAATNATIEIVSIIPATSRTGAIIIARFVNSDGTTLTADEVEEMVSDPEYSSELEEFGLIDIGDGSSDPQDQMMAIVLGVLGVVAGLILVVVSTTVFIKKKKKEEKEKKDSNQRKLSNRSQGNLMTF